MAAEKRLFRGCRALIGGSRRSSGLETGDHAYRSRTKKKKEIALKLLGAETPQKVDGKV